MVSGGQMHRLKLEKADDLWMFPREGSSRMLVNEVLASSELSPIKLTTKVEVPDAFLNCNFEFLWIHVSIIHVAVPDAEFCTGR